MTHNLPPIDIRRALLKQEIGKLTNTIFVNDSNAKAYARAGLADFAKSSAEEAAKFERVRDALAEQLSQLDTEATTEAEKT